MSNAFLYQKYCVTPDFDSYFCKISVMMYVLPYFVEGVSETIIILQNLTLITILFFEMPNLKLVFKLYYKETFLRHIFGETYLCHGKYQKIGRLPYKELLKDMTVSRGSL